MNEQERNEPDIWVTKDQFETLTKRKDGQRYLHKVTDLLAEIYRLKQTSYLCKTCGGIGWWEESVFGWGGAEQYQKWCPECMGTGSLLEMERARAWKLAEKVEAEREASRKENDKLRARIKELEDHNVLRIQMNEGRMS